MCSERAEWSKALEAEAPLLGAEAGAGAGREDTAAAAAACRSAGRVDAASAPLDAAARGGPAHQAEDHADIHLALAILSNLKGAGVGAGGSLGDDSSGLGLETPSGSASSSTSASAAPDDFSAAPSSEGDEDDDDEEEEEHDATERTPLHAARPALAVAIVPAKQAAPDAEATAVPESPRSTASQGAPRGRASSNRSSSGSSSSGRTTYSGDLEAGGDPAAAKGKVPDGGWGWVVVAASFVMSMIADGISFSFGLLFVRFLAHFEDSRSKTSWIGSLFMSVPLMSGPLGSALVDRYGCRTMTIVGGLVSALGFVLSAVANSIEMLIVTFGVIAGLGLGLCYVTCVVSIAFWFDKRRALATGLAAAGTGFGTFVYAPLTNLFLVEYGWRGALLLLAGTLLHMCVCGAVMRDPDWWVAEQAKAARAEAKAAAEAAAGAGGVSTGSSCGGGAALDGGGGGDPGLEEARRMLKMGRSPEYVLAALAANGHGPAHGPAHPHGGLANGHCCSSVLNLPTFVRQDESVPVEVLEKLSTNQRVLRAVLDKCPSLFPARSLSDSGPLAALPPPPPSAANGTGARARGGSDRRPQAALAPGALALPSLKRARCGVAQPSHYLKGIRVHRNSVMYRGAMLNIHKYKLRASSCPDIFRNSMTTIAQEQEEHWYSDMLTLLRGMTDFSLFAELHFTLMQLSTVLLFIWFIVPYFYLADYMTENNYTETEASWLLSIIGITNTIGIVGLGWAGDQPWVNVPKTFAGCLVLCGLSALAMPLCKENFFALAFASGLFGLFFASSFSFTPVILVQLVPLEKFTTAYGLVLLCQGIGNLIGPPVGGWLYDVTKTYDLSFYLTGIWIVVSGLLIAVIPMTKNHRLWGTSVTDKEKEIKEADQVSCA